MYIRLGFAIAALSEPEILIVDEVLAVGDMNFQKKCYDYLYRLKRNGTSVILVSHSIGAIWAVCDRGMFMHKGRVVVAGTVQDIVRAYDEQNAERTIQSASDVQSAIEVAGDGRADTTLVGAYGHRRGGTGGRDYRECPDLWSRQKVEFLEPIQIEAVVVVMKHINNAILRFTIDAAHYKFICVIDTLENDFPIERLEPGTYRMSATLKTQNFRPGAYKINANVCARQSGVHIYYEMGACAIHIVHPKHPFLYAEDNAIVHIPAAFDLHRESAELSRNERSAAQVS